MTETTINVNQTLLNQVEDLLNSINGRVSSLEHLSSQDSPFGTTSHSPFGNTSPDRSLHTSKSILTTPGRSPLPPLSPSSKISRPKLRNPPPDFSELETPSNQSTHPVGRSKFFNFDDTEENVLDQDYTRRDEATSPSLSRDVSLEDLAEYDIHQSSSHLDSSSLYQSSLLNSVLSISDLQFENEAIPEPSSPPKTSSSLNSTSNPDSNIPGFLPTYRKTSAIPTPRKKKRKPTAHKLSAFALLAIEHDGHVDCSGGNLSSKVVSLLGPEGPAEYRKAFPVLSSFVVNAINTRDMMDGPIELKPWTVSPNEWSLFKELISL
ncbi:hypothetical protein GEMRC1_000870 [Eukaryota sp. GEM-RC1]